MQKLLDRITELEKSNSELHVFKVEAQSKMTFDEVQIENLTKEVKIKQMMINNYESQNKSVKIELDKFTQKNKMLQLSIQDLE